MTEIELLVLATLATEPLHGYALAREVGAMSGGRVRVRPGNLYRVLDRLERRGLVRAASTGSEDGGERRQAYRLTARGRRAALAELNMYADVLVRVRAAMGGAADG